jgi:PAS domain S-box-containing protein
MSRVAAAETTIGRTRDLPSGAGTDTATGMGMGMGVGPGIGARVGGGAGAGAAAALGRSWRALVTPIGRAIDRALRIGVHPPLPIDVIKRIRLCNLLALSGSAIMAPWALIELLFGEPANLPSELGSLVGFLAVLGLNAVRAHRAARLLLLAIANACVLSGALVFEAGSGGTLPFFALVGLPLLLFVPAETGLVIVGALLPILLFAVCHSGPFLDWLAIHARPAPRWYYAANVASAFGVGFVVPFFFYRSNLKAEAALERIGQEKLKRVIDSNLIGVVRGRMPGQILEANDTFLNLLGFTRQDLATGALDLKTIAPLEPFAASGTRPLGDLPRGGATSVYERTFVRGDGTVVPALVGVSLLDEGEDEVVGFVLDLTAQKNVESQKAMLRETHEALRLRDLFNSIASHELKTPLAALMLNIQMLHRLLDKEAPANTALKLKAERCESSAARMGELIHALLDVAQIHDGKLRLCIQEMDVVEAVRRVVTSFESNRGAPQTIAVLADGPVSAHLDSLRFDQVLTNLLSNAVKYGAGQPIEVRVSRDDATDSAHIEVTDRGPGIEPAMMQKIFEPFQRAVATEVPIPGLGLGLYVVKMIVESHGGRVLVDSRLGEGSRFVVDLPCSGALGPRGPETPLAEL